jgi:hypothetical protein
LDRRLSTALVEKEPDSVGLALKAVRRLGVELGTRPEFCLKEASDKAL